jgi:hypothetical protein
MEEDSKVQSVEPRVVQIEWPTCMSYGLCLQCGVK